MKCFSPDLALSAGLAPNRFPETNDEADIAEHALAKELEKLSLVEHEKILFDLHGIARTKDEDPTKIDALLKELDCEVDKIKEKKAYEEARAINKSYVDDKKFRIMFLRGELLNPKAAAETLVLHFDIKKKIFGAGEILARDIRLNDLTPDDIKCLESGFTQVLPSRDVAGRTVVVINKAQCSKELVSPLTRACWYFNMQIMRDEETQKNGLVVILYNYDHYREQVDFNKEVHQLREALPQKMHAAHYCYNDPTLRPFVAGIRLFIDPQARFRLRPHYGSPEEIKFELQTFGIPTHDSPMRNDGSWSTDWHLEWLSALRAQEEKEVVQHESTTEESIILPRRFDVLYGKSSRERSHTGNLRAMHLCDMHWDKYEAAGKFQKTEVAERIVSIIHQSGGRFLKLKKEGWIEVTDHAAREKISHFFRHMRWKHRVSTSSSSSSSTNVSENFATDSPDAHARRLVPAKRVTPCPSPDLIAAI